MNRLDTKTRTAIARCLIEGVGINATCRTVGVAKHTVLKLLAELGEACLDAHDKIVRNLTCERIQCDEIWAFVGSKERHTSEEKKAEGWGDIWTWTAIDADTKFNISWVVGNRTASEAYELMFDISERVNGGFQLTTDGNRMYLKAAVEQFGVSIDYAQLVKHYGETPESERRYSPVECIGCTKERVIGFPDPQHVSTSYVERANLIMRMSMRRFTRLTNGHSKKVQNHVAAVSLYFMYYNFCRPHQTLTKKNKYPTTPAMAAGVVSDVWPLEKLIELL
jgi:IS1 family transposase